MLAMQYTIELPVNFDESLVRKRVNERSKLFDILPGLAHKSFLFHRDEHIYAPFYIWQNHAAARDFLLNDLFKGVIETFTRPRVRTWSVLDMAYGNKTLQPKFAVREVDIIAADENLQTIQQKEINAQAELLQNPNLHFHAIALDADRWELVRYSLWKDEQTAEKPAADCIQTYEILHVSEPGLNS